MSSIKLTMGFILLIASFHACKDPYEVKLKFKEKNFLVVEGFINIGDGVTQIKLSRVTAPQSGNSHVTETMAAVFIENNAGAEYELHHISNGLYESGDLNLSPSEEYRLRIEVSDKVYYSEFTSVTQTPPIDSVSWTRGSDDYIAIHVNTHDPQNKTFYYKWEYEEVWEARSTYISRWAYENGVSRIRTTEEVKKMSVCWPYKYNADLLFTSSAQLTTDVIRLFPLTRFYITDPRLGWRYSITVKQRALTLAEYEFLQIMKKNSSDLGSLFDAQPSQLIGNVYCTTTDEPVVGFIGSYTSQQTQLILYRSIISDFTYITPCYFESAPALFSDPSFPDYLVYYTPLEPIYGPSEDDALPIIGFLLGRTSCVDCRLSSGTADKPDFWE